MFLLEDGISYILCRFIQDYIFLCEKINYMHSELAQTQTYKSFHVEKAIVNFFVKKMLFY